MAQHDAATPAVPLGTAQSSAWASVFTMINVAVGAGVLSLPYAYSCTGWAAGLLLTAGVAAAEAFTLYTLTRLAAATRSTTYSELVSGLRCSSCPKSCCGALKATAPVLRVQVHCTLGKGGGLFISAALFLYLWGSCVA